MRHHAWNEADHPRDDHGRFGHGHGSDHHTPDGGSHGGSERGMPAAVSTNTAKLSSGETITIDRHHDGGVTLTTEHGQVTYEEEDFDRLLKDLSLSEDWPPGETGTVETAGHITETGGLWRENIALIERTGTNTLNLHLRDDNPDLNELREAPPIHLTDKDIGKLEQAHERSLGAFRIDTGNGDADLSISDDNKFVLRHLGNDGTPVETRLDPKSFAALSRAINVVYEGFDEDEEFAKGDAADNVTRVDVNTNAGKVRVELFGEWHGTNPGDRLEVMALDDSWGIAVDGPKQDAFDHALSEVENVAESLGFFDRLMGTRWVR